MQSVKALIAELWSPAAPRLRRAAAAERLRRKTLTVAGMEEARHGAGLESLLKLADEGTPAEKARTQAGSCAHVLYDMHDRCVACDVHGICISPSHT